MEIEPLGSSESVFSVAVSKPRWYTLVPLIFFRVSMI